MRKILFLILLSFIFFNAKSQNVDTVSVYSPSMKKYIKNVVILPESYNKNKNDRYPVLYLLHGAYGNYSNWIKNAKYIPEYANLYDIIVVCPDGHPFSWYWDSPVDSTFRYETYITKELLENIDKNYRTKSDRNSRAITGLSMGGHGALLLSMKHQDLYGAAGSISGGVDISVFPDSWEREQRLGASMAQNPELWVKHSVMGNLHLLKPNSLKIIFDCGSEDFFFKVNEKLHDELSYRNIPHDYITRPGKHDWNYWNNALKYQILYFNEFFKNEKQKTEKK